jgi:hypothetical protein
VGNVREEERACYGTVYLLVGTDNTRESIQRPHSAETAVNSDGRASRDDVKFDVKSSTRVSARHVSKSCRSERHRN